MIAFRVDGNPSIGAGHIMRCLSIANVVKNSDEDSVFIVSDDNFRNLIIESGHEILNLKSEYTRMEPGEILPAFVSYEPLALFVDSYFVTEQYMVDLHKLCKEHGSKLVYIDDRCIQPFSCDFLLNYNIFSCIEDYERLYSGKWHPSFMMGTSYTPLRKEFKGIERKNILPKATNIMVSTGGADSEHLTIDIMEKVMKVSSEYIFHFVIGMMNLDKKKILEKAKKRSNIVIHENVKRMDSLMRSCDVAISAAGSTLYELCATKTPSITYILADNQIPAAEKFAEKGIMKNCGDIRVLGNKELASKLVDEAILLAENFEERKRMIEQMDNVVDGMGASRILGEILNKENIDKM